MKNIFVTLLLFLMMASPVTAVSIKAKPKFTLRQADSLFNAQQWKSAIPVYESVLKAGPNNALGWNRLGFCYHNLNDYDKAILKYNKALLYTPAASLETVIQSRLARAYSMRKENDKAFASLDRAIQLGYTNVGELEKQSEFDNIRSDSRYAGVMKAVTNNAFPCMTNAQAREFDFWIGDWDAYVTGTTQLAGQSRIDLASGGCMILENWTSKGNVPFTGKSMNFVDPATNKWKQVWIGSGGINVSEFLNGEYRDNAMRFEFESTNAQGVKTLTHFHFFNQGPDQVRQFHETSVDDGKTWTTTYDFTYVRKK
ncbi:MAG TPA: tetratricopeptide repeat protein [Chryseolinea sp.]|nr:tetratricopeptide repeat protein [Chryseolinea sp.]